MEYADILKILKNRADSGDIKIYYNNENIILAGSGEELYICTGERVYAVSSNPYEPCTYLYEGEELCAVIHNAFELRAILGIAQNGGNINSVTGAQYDISRLCRTLAYAAENRTDCNIDHIEGKLAIEKMKKLGAIYPETAVKLETLGLRSISVSFSHSKKLTERVMYTRDGRVYLSIKKTK